MHSTGDQVADTVQETAKRCHRGEFPLDHKDSFADTSAYVTARLCTIFDECCSLHHPFDVPLIAHVIKICFHQRWSRVLPFFPLFLPSPRGHADSTCSNGVPGIEGTNSAGYTACCSLTCIDDGGNPRCGGSGCKSREGGGSGCCIGKINRKGDDCADNGGVAPCFIGERLTQSDMLRLPWAPPH